MGKACLLLAAMMVALFLFPKNQVSGASLENPLASDLEIRNADTDGGGLDYDYAFLNQPSFSGGFQRRLSKTLKRHGRLMKRLRRYAKGDGPIPANKIPAGCCSCGDHYCCDGMCHGK